jgi:hypothetical protein
VARLSVVSVIEQGRRLTKPTNSIVTQETQQNWTKENRPTYSAQGSVTNTLVYQKPQTTAHTQLIPVYW